jgi:hypothetical protein
MDKQNPPSMNETPVAAWFNPADYFTFVLDREIRKAGLPGGYCGLVLELGAVPDLERLQQRLDLLAERFPQAAARLERRGRRYGWVATGRRLPLENHRCPPGEDLESFCRQALLGVMNRPADPARDPSLGFHWFGDGTRGQLLLYWLHPLLDARGAKILLDFLDAGEPDGFRESPPLVGHRLAQWSLWRKVGLALKAKRHNDRTNGLDSCLPTGAEGGPQTLRLRVRCYDAEQTGRISRLALRHTGPAGKALYYIGCLMRAMERAGPAVAKDGYCIPYAFNLRRQNAATPVFGNQVGCLFAQADRARVRDREGLLGHLLAQYRQTVKDELDFAYLPLMWLGQWLPPDRYARLLRKQRSGGELSSAWFSEVGDLRFGAGRFLGAPVDGVFHLCWMTPPPGLALLAGQTDGRLTLSYNYLHPAVDEDWLAGVMAIMDQELLEDGAPCC